MVEKLKSVLKNPVSTDAVLSDIIRCSPFSERGREGLARQGLDHVVDKKFFLEKLYVDTRFRSEFTESDKSPIFQEGFHDFS